jgi:hypothetical protein
VPGPTALTGLQGFVQSTPELTPQEQQGGIVNAAHGLAFWEQPSPYPWESNMAGMGSDAAAPIAPYVGVGHLDDSLPAGHITQDPVGDYAPYRTHAAPHPVMLSGAYGMENQRPNGPGGSSDYLEQSDAVHSVDMNSSAMWEVGPAADPLQDDWTAFYDVERGQSNLTQPTPQMMSGGAPGGFGSRGRETTYARQNEYGFDSAHMHRRYATGSIPGNYMWMKPGGRPMVKTLPGPARPATGANSPFSGQDTGVGYYPSGNIGGILADPATEYVAPPTPSGLVPVVQTPDDSYAPTVEFW